MSDKLTISGVRAFGKHGVFPQEKIDEQLFIVDVVLKLDLRPAANNDDLEKSVNYDDVAVLIHDRIKGASMNLIEAMADRIGREIIERFELVEEVEVTVHKPNAPVSVPFGDVSVTIKNKR